MGNVQLKIHFTFSVQGSIHILEMDQHIEHLKFLGTE